jgi:hypothetical protein
LTDGLLADVIVPFVAVVVTVWVLSVKLNDTEHAPVTAPVVYMVPAHEPATHVPPTVEFVE